jgi:hypothetical protein
VLWKEREGEEGKKRWKGISSFSLRKEGERCKAGEEERKN